MPYTAKGKCVYRKDTGKKVGCTKGSVKKYLAALHANVKDVNESEEFDWVENIDSLEFIKSTFKEGDMEYGQLVNGSYALSVEVPEETNYSYYEEKSIQKELRRRIGVDCYFSMARGGDDELLISITVDSKEELLKVIDWMKLDNSLNESEEWYDEVLNKKPLIRFDDLMVGDVISNIDPEHEQPDTYFHVLSFVEGVTWRNAYEETEKYVICSLVKEDPDTGNFIPVSRTDMKFPRGKNIPMWTLIYREGVVESIKESEEFDWVEIPELPKDNDFISSVKYALEGSLYDLHIYTTGQLVNRDYRLVNLVELRKGNQTLFRKDLEYFTPENVKKEFDNLFTSIKNQGKMLGPGSISHNPERFPDLSSKMGKVHKLYFDAYELLKDLLPKDGINESEDDFEWAQETVKNSFLEFNGKEILIDIRGLDTEELKRLYEIIIPYVQTNSAWFTTHEGEEITWKDNLQCFENMLRDGVGKFKSISLHCGLEDNDYLPLKGAVCCLKGTYDDEPSYSKENIIPVNAREIIGGTINESEWFEDVVKDPIMLKVEDLEMGDIVIPNRFNQQEYIVTGKGTSVKLLHEPTHWVTLKRNTKENTGGVFIEHDSEIGKACRFELIHREENLNESEEDSELFWAEDLLKGMADFVDITDKLDIMEELPVGSVLMVSGYQDEMELVNEEVKLVYKADENDNFYQSTYYLFKLKNERFSDGSEMTHCGTGEKNRKICECREGTDDDLSQTEVGKCWWIELKKQDQVLYYPNRVDLTENKIKKPLLTEGRYDAITRKVVRDIMKAVTEGDSDSYNLPWDIWFTHDYEQEGLSFNLELDIVRSEEVDSFEVRTAIADEDEENVIMMTIILGPGFSTQKLQKLFYKLQEDIRHEIEHFTQMGPNRIEDRPVYKGSTANLKTIYGHHKNVIEIPALVHGFYRRAKLEKRPIDEIMMDDLDAEIERGLLTKTQAQKLLTIWVDYAKKNLPAAIYKQD